MILAEQEVVGGRYSLSSTRPDLYHPGDQLAFSVCFGVKYMIPVPPVVDTVNTA